MKVLFDAFWWFGGPPSGRNVLRSLVLAWSQEFPDDHLTLEIPAVDLPRRGEIRESLPNAEILTRRARLHAASVVLRPGFRECFDTVISQNFVTPFSRQHRTVFLHDAIFQEHPEWFSRKERIYLSVIPGLLRWAQLIATSSHAEKDRIQRLNHRMRTPVVAVGLGVPQPLGHSTATLTSLPLKPGRYILAVGRINVRKNIDTLARALLQRGTIAPEFPLVIVGNPDGISGEQHSTVQGIAAGSILSAGGVSDSELLWLYENCAVFAFPSLDEGFGLPVLEALNAGARLALSAIPAFTEFGDVGQFFDPEDIDDIADKVSAAIVAERPRLPDPSRYEWSTIVRRLRTEISDSIAASRTGGEK
ncbi:glycosyltransferase family 1 protein [Cryobacterium sp. GrIS_2_6]|uniref:glycosyltransferase family 4 protein n=1 Tax=Cryobacterium sp. GrIS_2_6 TaxID=3162785 RepID=UPI002E06D852|nr:glycosyltransferase involved in cell wall biosynthesis [Cryobacterium psychrotolerans]